jgi:hypothetical protein
VTALDTASRVLDWAANAAEKPPAGDLADAPALARPEPDARDRLRQLAVRTAAILGAGRPPFGDDGPVGLGALLLAAAVGGRADADATRLITGAVPALQLRRRPHEHAAPSGSGPPGWADAVARHGVVAPFLAPTVVASGRDDLIEGLLAASPLTSILLRPPSTQVAAGNYPKALESVTDLIAQPHGLEVLTTAFAAPTKDTATLAWRTFVLMSLTAKNRDAVLGVYLAVRVRHRADWDDLLDWAANTRRETTARVAVRQFWAPLAVLDRKDPTLLRSRLFLDDHHKALELAAQYIPASARAD